MSLSLIDLSTLANHTLNFAASAKACGFVSPGDIDRFLFQSYGKTVREIPPANRPHGAIFILNPAATIGALAPIAGLKPALLQIQTDVAHKFYALAIDLGGGSHLAHTTTANEQKMMASGPWPLSFAQLISRQTGKCVVWANGVSAQVYLAGDCYIESPDVVAELPTGLPTSFQSLSWDDGEIVSEFARQELNDTTPAGIWHLPDNLLLRPKPERLMSVGLGKFLRHRMAGYRHHDDEPYVENEGRADVSLVLYNGFVYIIEVKWVGRALSSLKQLEAKDAIKDALKKGTKGWITEYRDEDAFGPGAKQLAQYFSTGKYKRAYLAVFDCSVPKMSRQNSANAPSAGHVAPYNPLDFRIHRACVDPRKASKVSKAKHP